MKIGIGNDHRGVLIKKKLIPFLEKKGIEVIDMGSNDVDSSDFPLYAFQVGEAIAKKEVDLGILICGTGIGMNIACNKVKGVYCAKIDTKKEAFFAKSHNNANAISLSSYLSVRKMKKLINIYLESSLSEVPRYKKRIDMIVEYENGN